MSFMGMKFIYTVFNTLRLGNWEMKLPTKTDLITNNFCYILKYKLYLDIWYNGITSPHRSMPVQ